MDSILMSIKRMLGVPEEYDHFDPVLINHINTVFMILTQMGVGPPEGFTIQDADPTWSDFVSEEDDLEGVKTFMHHRVQLLFDPPSNSTLIGATKETVKELEWRLYITAESSTS